jgi:hypothetical protein
MMSRPCGQRGRSPVQAEGSREIHGLTRQHRRDPASSVVFVHCQGRRRSSPEGTRWR